MRIVDRLLSVLLILGGIGHTVGVLDYYHTQPDALFWSLTASELIFLLGAINLLRTWRPDDRLLAWITTVASATYFVITLGFGRLMHDMADPRVIAFGAISLGLTALGLKVALAR